jgi:hypothetical protein
MFERKSRLLAWAVGIALLLTGGASLAGETKGKRAKEEPKPAESSSEEGSSPYDAATSSGRSSDVITNEDLEKMMEIEPGTELSRGAPEPAAPAPKPGPKPKGKPKTVRTPMPFRVVHPSVAQLPKSQNELEAERKVATIQARVADLEKAVLAGRNPSLPRAWTKGAPVAAEAREAQLRSAREELSRARQELARFRSEAP